MDEERVIDALNDLIRTLEDSHLGLQRAAEDLKKNGEVAALCHGMADRRGTLIRAVQQRVAAIGGAPDATGTLLGGALRLAAELGATIGMRDTGDILDGLVQSHQRVLDHLGEALEMDLPHVVKAELAAHAAEVSRDRDRLEDTRAGLTPADSSPAAG